jgi:lysozyme
MDRLQEYRKVALEYLITRAPYLTLEVDDLLDYSLRSISKLPSRPSTADFYNGTLGMKPVVEQRKLCCKLLYKRLNSSSPEKVHYVDTVIDKAIRILNDLPIAPQGAEPYNRLFTLETKEELKEEYNSVTSYIISKKGVELIHSFESYRECTYKDPGSYNGLPITGGWGSTRLNGKPLELGACYPKKVWDAQFEKDLRYFEDSVRKHVKVPITQGMYDALVSWVYNCGVGVLINSTAIKRLNVRDYEGASEAMTWYNKGNNGKTLAGLVRRRKEERELFLS